MVANLAFGGNVAALFVVLFSFLMTCLGEVAETVTDEGGFGD